MMVTLSKIERDVLKNLINGDMLYHTHHHWGINYICDLFPPTKYRRTEIKIALDNLVEKDYITKANNKDDYYFSEDQQILWGNNFRWVIRWKKLYGGAKKLWLFLWKHFIITIMTSAITALVTMYLKNKF